MIILPRSTQAGKAQNVFIGEVLEEGDILLRHALGVVEGGLGLPALVHEALEQGQTLDLLIRLKDEEGDDQE